MSWTEESIVAEFKKHVIYWQEKLRLRDIEVHVEVRDHISDDQATWCSIQPCNVGANPYAADLRVKRGSFDDETPYTIWSTVAHELVHMMNWSMSLAFEPLTDHFSVSQLNMAKSLMKRGNEELAYKWEAILTAWFAADAPSREIPPASSPV